MMSSLFSGIFPVENPIAVFLIVLLIILMAPIVFKRLGIPHIVGMILAGMIVGPYALNILPFDRSIDVFGKVGLYYIMFLAGMEIDISDLKKNLKKSILFGLATFAIPSVFALLAGKFLLGFSLMACLLLAAMFASHTLVSFPIISRYGLSNRSAVNIAVGGTVIAVTFSMIILAAVDSAFHETGGNTWLPMLVKMTVSLLVIFFAIPKCSQWFLNKYEDGILRFVYVLAMAFLGALLTEISGFQGVLGAFFVGLALNTQVPKLSSLMNRVEFVGNAIFFPYFLISIGMMINLRAFTQGWEGWYVAIVMSGSVLLGKWLAAKCFQWGNKMSHAQGNLLFGLTSGRAAVTLAVVMIGYNIIVGYNEDGTPIRLLNEFVFNGSVVMILISCLVSSVVTEKSAKQLLLERNETAQPDEKSHAILVPVANPRVIDQLLQLAVSMKNPKDKLYTLSVVDENAGMDRKQCSNLLNMAAHYAASIDADFHQVMRFDSDVATGIVHAVREYQVSDVIVGMQHHSHLKDNPFGVKLSNLLKHSHYNIFITRFVGSIDRMKRLVVMMPEKAEYEHGFFLFMQRCYTLCRQMQCNAVIYAHPDTLQHVRQLMHRFDIKITIELNELHNWQNVPMLIDSLSPQDMITFVLSRKNTVSYAPVLDEIPLMIESHFPDRMVSFFYPEQTVFVENITTYSGPLQVQTSTSPKEEVSLLKQLSNE